MTHAEIQARRIEQERVARKEAESLLEQKSHDLYLANENLMHRSRELAAAFEPRAILERLARPVTEGRRREARDHCWAIRAAGES